VIKDFHKGSDKQLECEQGLVGHGSSALTSAVLHGSDAAQKGERLTREGLQGAMIKGLSGMAGGQIASAGYRGAKGVMNRFKPTRKVLKSRAFQNYVDPVLSSAIPLAGSLGTMALLPPPAQAALAGASLANEVRKVGVGVYRKRRALKKLRKMHAAK
jgi:hypothetical protein